jgi:hypothetical protein
VSANGLQDSSTGDKYVNALYYAFATIATVGYGDISPVTFGEKIFGMLFMIMACGFFAYIIGSIGTIVNRSDMLSAEFRLRQLHISQFLVYRQIPKRLRMRIMSYLDYLVDYKHMYKLEENEVLMMLNESLRCQCIVYLNGRMLKKSMVFQKFNILFLSEITFILTHKTFSLEDIVFEEGHPGGEIYFINKGTIFLIHMATKTYIKELGQEEFFGEYSFFTKKPRVCSARSNVFTETLFLTREDFLECAKGYPEAEQFFHYIKDEIGINGNFAPIGVKCYVCKEIGHISVKCRDFWKVEGNIKRRNSDDFMKQIKAQMRKMKQEQQIAMFGKDKASKREKLTQEQRDRRIKRKVFRIIEGCNYYEDFKLGGDDEFESSSEDLDDDEKIQKMIEKKQLLKEQQKIRREKRKLRLGRRKQREIVREIRRLKRKRKLLEE